MDDGASTYKEACRHRENWLRFWAIIIGVGLGELSLTLIGHPWNLALWRILAGLLCAIIAYSIPEVVIGIGFIEFFKNTHELDLRHHVRYFLENHKEVDLAEKAKVALTLILADPRLDIVEMQIPFPHYLKLLSAATVFTQGEWFATLRMPLEKWSEISTHSLEYFEALERAHFRKKLRILIRPADEISTLDEQSEVVRDTRRVGSRLYCIPADDELARRIDDYAIFDDKLVITAVPLPTRNDGSALGLSDRYQLATNLDQKYLVKLLRGPDKISEYKKDKDTLLALAKQDACRKFRIRPDQKPRRRRREETQ